MRSKCWMCLNAALLVMGVAVSAVADCGDDSNNLMSTANCDFDSGIAGWAASTGTFSWEMTDGDPEAGALHGFTTSDILIGSSPCFAVLPSTMYGLGLRLRVVFGASSLCTASFEEFSDASCTLLVSSGGIASLPNPTGTWTHIHVDRQTDGAAMFVRVTLNCDATGARGAAGDFRFDNFYYGVGLTVPVELTSFSVE